jgi:hypothetical protein
MLMIWFAGAGKARRPAERDSLADSGLGCQRLGRPAAIRKVGWLAADPALGGLGLNAPRTRLTDLNSEALANGPGTRR